MGDGVYDGRSRGIRWLERISRRIRSPIERGHHGGGTQDGVSILAAGAESVAARSRVVRPLACMHESQAGPPVRPMSTI